MKANWAKSWIGSIRPNKQRKFRFNAPLHIKQKFVSVHLSSELRKKHGRRSVGVRTGDKVWVLRGQYKKKTGKVNKVELRRQRVYIDGIENVRKEGTKSFVALQPSNLMIVELDLSDKKRKAKLAVEEVKKVSKKEKEQKNG